MAKSKSKPRATKSPRRSVRELAHHADLIIQEGQRRATEYSRLGITMVFVPRQELIRNLSGKSIHSPFLTWIGYSGAVRGATFLIDFGIMQPDGYLVYSEANLGLCYCWSDAGGLTDPGLTLARAAPSVGVIQVPIGTLNSATMPYTLSSTHLIPSSFRLGPADLNYFLYMPDPFGPATLLKRGTIRLVVS
jgi:hypothetical protein